MPTITTSMYIESTDYIQFYLLAIHTYTPVRTTPIEPPPRQYLHCDWQRSKSDAGGFPQLQLQFQYGVFYSTIIACIITRPCSYSLLNSKWEKKNLNLQGSWPSFAHSFPITSLPDDASGSLHKQAVLRSDRPFGGYCWLFSHELWCQFGQFVTRLRESVVFPSTEYTAVHMLITSQPPDLLPDMV